MTDPHDAKTGMANEASGQEHVPVISPSLTGPEIFAAISREGREELERPASSLWWSALAAGLVISLSHFCKSFLYALLPDEPWRAAVTSWGYCVGFVIVVLGRLQLFTENTITTVLPLLETYSSKALLRTAKLWAIVLGGNLVGCLLAAAVVVYFELAPESVREAAREIAQHYARRSAGAMFGHGVPAGFLVAAMVWSSPAAGSSRFWVIVMCSYMISAGDLTHVVAGATELLMLVLHGELSVWTLVAEGIVPTCAGNILGGTVFFALLVYAQAREELDT